MLQSLYSLSGQIYLKMWDTPGIEQPANWELKLTGICHFGWIIGVFPPHTGLSYLLLTLWGQLGQGCSYWLGSCTESLAFVLHKHRRKTGGKRSGGCRSHRQMLTWLRRWESWTPLVHTSLQQTSEMNEYLYLETDSPPITLTAATASDPRTSGTLRVV